MKQRLTCSTERFKLLKDVMEANIVGPIILANIFENNNLGAKEQAQITTIIFSCFSPIKFQVSFERQGI
jgi:hypothetical protein